MILSPVFDVEPGPVIAHGRTQTKLHLWQRRASVSEDLAECSAGYVLRRGIDYKSVERGKHGPRSWSLEDELFRSRLFLDTLVGVLDFFDLDAEGTDLRPLRQFIAMLLVIGVRIVPVGEDEDVLAMSGA